MPHHNLTWEKRCTLTINRDLTDLNWVLIMYFCKLQTIDKSGCCGRGSGSKRGALASFLTIYFHQSLGRELYLSYFMIVSICYGSIVSVAGASWHAASLLVETENEHHADLPLTGVEGDIMPMQEKLVASVMSMILCLQ